MNPPSEEEIQAVEKYNLKNGHVMPEGVWCTINHLCNYTRETEKTVEGMQGFAKSLREFLGIE